MVEMKGGGGSGGYPPPQCARKCANFRNLKANVHILDRKTPPPPQMVYPISPTGNNELRGVSHIWLHHSVHLSDSHISSDSNIYMDFLGGGGWQVARCPLGPALTSWIQIPVMYLFSTYPVAMRELSKRPLAVKRITCLLVHPTPESHLVGRRGVDLNLASN